MEAEAARGSFRVARRDLRVRPTVQGAVVVLENKTGRVLAMTGGFSYPTSQLNRDLADAAPAGFGDQAYHLFDRAAEGLQPNTLVPDVPDAAADRQRELWQHHPRLQRHRTAGRLLVAAQCRLCVGRRLHHAARPGKFDQRGDRASARRRHRRRSGGEPRRSLRHSQGCGHLSDCVRYYPFVLGAQPVH